MWDDFLIGEPDKNSTAVHIEGYSGLSHSYSHYWWHSVDLCLSGRIHKCSAAGVAIARMHADGVSQEAMEAFIVKEGIAVMSPQAVKDLLARFYHAAYQAGRANKAREICRCLGVEPSD